MTATVDAVGPTTAHNTAAASLTWSHTCGANAKLLLAAIAVGTNAGDDGNHLASMTFNAQTMTSVGKVHSGASPAAGYVEVFAYANPDTSGAHNVVASVTGGNVLSLSGASVSLKHCLTTLSDSAITANNSSMGTAFTAADASNTAGNLIVGFVTGGTLITSWTAPAVSKVVSDSGASNNAAIFASIATAPATGSSVTMAGAIGGSDWWGEVLLEVQDDPNAADEFAHDATTRLPATDTTGFSTSAETISASHLGATHAAAAVVIVGQTGTTNNVTSVTYGGVSLGSAVTSASDSTEANRIDVYVLTSGVLGGSQTVAVTRTGTNQLWATCATATASTGALAVHTSDKVDTQGSANPTVTLTTTVTTQIYGGVGSGVAAPTSLTPGSGLGTLASADYGALSARSGYSLAPVAAGSPTFNWSAGNDDWCIAAVALAEVTIVAGTGTWAAATTVTAPATLSSNGTWAGATTATLDGTEQTGGDKDGTGTWAGATAFTGGSTILVVGAGTWAQATEVTATASILDTTVHYPKGIHGTGASYFTDQNGDPIWVLGDELWCLPHNAGRWSSGDWPGEIDAYLESRAAQGFTALYTRPWGNTVQGGLYNNGHTYDNVSPWNSGSAATGTAPYNFNNTFWTRIDYLFNKAKSLGITVFFNLAMTYPDMDSGASGVAASWTTTNWTNYGKGLGYRYKDYENIFWMIGDDGAGFSNAEWDAALTGLRAVGDAHGITPQYESESTSRYNMTTGLTHDASFNDYDLTWGVDNAQYNFVYSYNVGYWGIEEAYKEPSPITVMRGDGNFYGQVNGSNSPEENRLMRNLLWWAISSGARGFNIGSQGVWQWDSSSCPTNVTAETFFGQVPALVRDVFTHFVDWWLLVPDTSNQLITSGRGTRASAYPHWGDSGTYFYSGTSDTYVSGSRSPTGSIAVIYMSHASTITIDETKLVTPYSIRWADPITGALTFAAVGDTGITRTDSTHIQIASGTAKGNNSGGDPDWLLVLQFVIPGDGTWTQATSVAAEGHVVISAGATWAASATVTAHATLGSAFTAAASTTVVADGIPGVSGTATVATSTEVTATVTQGVVADWVAATATTLDYSIIGTTVSGDGYWAAATTVVAPAGLAVTSATWTGSADVVASPTIIAGIVNGTGTWTQTAAVVAPAGLSVTGTWAADSAATLVGTPIAAVIDGTGSWIATTTLTNHVIQGAHGAWGLTGVYEQVIVAGTASFTQATTVALTCSVQAPIVGVGTWALHTTWHHSPPPTGPPTDGAMVLVAGTAFEADGTNIWWYTRAPFLPPLGSPPDLGPPQRHRTHASPIPFPEVPEPWEVE